MRDDDVKRLLALGLNADEVWCAIAEAGPWTLSLTEEWTCQLLAPTQERKE